MNSPRDDLIAMYKKQYFNDYLVLIDSVVCGFKAYVFTDLEIAKREHARITKNCDLLKPCTVELIPLFGGNDTYVYS